MVFSAAAGPAFPARADSASSGESNSAGTRGAKEERMEVLRLSRSRASRTRVPEPELVEAWRGEPPFSMWDGIAEGFEGGESEPMMMNRELVNMGELSETERSRKKKDLGEQ